ncbi:S1 family peptidase [Marinihelvus fidelis]|nr:S1 family peptidase [Marinihelvus fidelis]
MIQSLKAAHGLDEEGVIERLVAEQVAFDQHELAVEVLGDSFAGAWFDEEKWLLTVAAVPGPRVDVATRLGLNIVSVDRTLEELQAILSETIKNAHADEDWEVAFAGAGIDLLNNAIVIKYKSHYAEFAINSVNKLHNDVSSIRLEEVRSLPTLSQAILGGNHYHNPVPQYDCSIGFATISGFYTAGHCGSPPDSVEDQNGNPMGLFVDNDWTNNDIALVDIDPGWATTDQVNGYSDGIISVPAAYGGFRTPLTGTSVCRSGQATGGLHCGTILATNDTQQFGVPGGGYVTLSGTVKTDVCQLGGDSGGPFIVASSHLAQGTLIGGYPTSCPGTSSGAWFEPISKHMTELGDEIRTTHGSNPPDITNPVCPDTSLLAAGQFLCDVGTYDSQGLTDVTWTSSVPGQPVGVNNFYFGTCTPGFWVNVDLELENAHGSDSQSFGFTCPSFP